MIYLRSFLFQLVFWLWSAGMAVFMLVTLPMPRAVNRACMATWSRGLRLLLRVLVNVKIEIRGQENIPHAAGLVAAKHQSMFDVFSQFSILPDACFVMKKELLMVPLFGWHGLKADMIVVDRDGHSAALKKLVRDAVGRMKESRQIVIFPEGTRGKVGEPGDYKPGIAALYRELNMPVTPLALNCGSHWNKGFLVQPGTIVFEYLPAIPAGLKRGEFMRELQTRIDAATKALEDAGL
ncbi:lysophospholipid acyltransferase family protein [Caulobacter vibrioides]|uniref:1-acyl-sn-glycerol-3-phosphate acyltransferase n=2 Tax=Caulobacter vibrioides TaxID=155892 RepID=Q9A675_CAUVC|nr:1-acyl-sn-glycerol-3-phosphate acyltransferase [Caulobacter vibrioides]YP_002517675.1 1-acyl-sn-glycerol-3-phosphate acyltransferase [Caulobacter vibrioides NA1000]QBQ57239.1 1-acyl-sn-glycerol-3-phosphate acyltransferase [synthetic Caulobacter sp. 'ethensis']AAK24190.1 1-acyl-sn-glycerol-3-phosphate acyltransferase [Caulobacter vibrioides CB15]ACL95767.1 1-acyl-sn-glycerol-3-phosphate acyltransferase [Caulobacter vibrioides NA1000]ATC29083.1 1-acyl-sn-glycerol-3-phosphate acyltransferase [